jgi:hypothetical protein
LIDDLYRAGSGVLGLDADESIMQIPQRLGHVQGETVPPGRIRFASPGLHAERLPLHPFARLSVVPVHTLISDDPILARQPGAYLSSAELDIIVPCATGIVDQGGERPGAG